MPTPFDAIATNVNRRLDELGEAVLSQEFMERLVAGRVPRTKGLCKKIVQQLQKEVGNAPNSLDIRVHNHCAAVINLYSVFERCVLELVRAWLQHVPSLYVKYKDLPELMRKRHCEGVSKLLVGGRGRRTEMPQKDLVEGLYKGLLGEPYSLSLDPFRHERANLRLQQINQLFSDVALPQPSSWLRNFNPLVEHIQSTWSSTTTVDATLAELVRVRNEAAHDEVQETWAVEVWQQYQEFVRVVCLLLLELVSREYIRRGAMQGVVNCIGKTIKKFSGNVSGVRVEPCRLAEGDELIVVSKYRCFAVEIRRIEIRNRHRQRIQPRSPVNVGLELSRPAPSNAEFYRL